MNFYSNLPNISISQFDGEINLYDVNKNSDIYLKKNDGKNFSNFLNKVGELSPYLKKISKDEKKWLNAVKDKNLNQILNDLISDKKDLVEFCIDDLIEKEGESDKKKIFSAYKKFSNYVKQQINHYLSSLF